MASLPIPSPHAQALSQQLAHLIQQKIKNAGGWINFVDFMHMALYTPSLGYYSGGAKKFGMGGDFVTAPEISPLFAKTLALQAAQILVCSDGDILELGAGTGKLAADLLLELQVLNQLPKQYFILEVSDYLRQIQRETLQKKLPAALFNKIVWLDELSPSPQPSPTRGEGVIKGFSGLVLANEVLDAIPAHLIVNTAQGLHERGVSFDSDFIWQDKPLAKGKLYDEVSAYSLPNDYLTEFCPAASGLMNSLADCLKQGVILLIDYGFSAREYYHPQRNLGTLMCHYQHYAHSNPLINVGLQDITAHVNFSQIAYTAQAHGIRLAGYVNQAQFLINCGILDVLSQTSPNDMAAYAPLAAAAQKLLSPAEMGELFKVIAFSKDFDAPLIGFKDGDKAHTL
jgi:SAM-dependent MidA family methyltransferase